MAEDELAVVPAWLRPLAQAARAARAEQLSAFLPPEDGSGRASAVLMAFSDLAAADDGAPPAPGVLLIERAATMRTHANQVAFPGGATDLTDADPVATALREAEEEVGLAPADVHVAARLPAIFLPPTAFVVTPVLGWFDRPQQPRAVDPAEVARVAVVPVAELADPANRFRVVHPSGWHGAAFMAAGLFVWGFTAVLLDRLLEMGGWALPWDDTVFRPLPARLVSQPLPPA
jgi:8-oxo-dGTP pyrophosphatase MutT (NUDIX family)